MVAVAIGLFVTVAVLYMQLKLTAQNVRSSDTVLRDNEARAAMDSITRDLSGGGFLYAGNNGTCYAVLNYNTAVPAPNYFAGFPVSALAGGANVVLPFVAAPGITLNYPVAGSVNRSDVLVLRATSDASQFSAALTPVVPTMDNTAYTPMTSGLLPFATSPAPPLTVGHMGLVMVNVGTPPASQITCIRIPISSAAIASGSANIGSTGALMPAAFYTGFSGQLGGIGLGAASLSDILLRSSKVIDLGTSAASNQMVYAYFVVAPAATNNYKWPMLVRATINPLTDLEVPGSRQEIAAGVVSFQVLFGTGTPTTGVTAYQTWAQVVAGGSEGSVMSVRIMVLMRSLYPDKDFSNSVQPVLQLRTQFSQNAYTDYTIPASEMSNRFVAQETELTVRSSSPLWPK